MSVEVLSLVYLLGAVAFIIGLKRLSGPRTARSGNLVAALGMLLVIVITLVDFTVSWAVVVAGLVVGAAIGAVLAIRVQMTAMPQLVAAFNGFGGLASALSPAPSSSRTPPTTTWRRSSRSSSRSPSAP